MGKRKLWFRLGPILLAVLLCLGGCGGKEQKAPFVYPLGEGPLSGVSMVGEPVPDFDAAWYLVGMTFRESSLLREGAAAHVMAEYPGLQVMEYGAGSDSMEQIIQVEIMVSSGVDAIIIEPVDPYALQSALDLCNEVGVALVILDTPSRYAGMEATFVYGDQNDAVEVLAARLAHDMAAEDTLTVMDAATGQDDAFYTDALLGEPGCEVAWYLADWDRYNLILEQLLDGELSGYLLFVDDAKACMVADRLRAMEEDPTAFAMVGTGGSEAAIEAVLAGDLLALMWRDEYAIAATAVDAAIALSLGEELAYSYPVPYHFVTAENGALYQGYGAGFRWELVAPM